MPARHASHLQDTYAQIAQGYTQVNDAKANTKELEFFSTLIPQGGKVLDLGSGPGRDAALFIERGFQVTCFDLSSELLALAKARVPEATCVQGDMTELPFHDQSFDGIWANASLLHLTKEEMQHVLHKVFHLLKHKGIFFCSLKKGEGQQMVTTDKYGKSIERFFSFFQEEELLKALKEAGFTIIESFPADVEADQEWLHVFSSREA